MIDSIPYFQNQGAIGHRPLNFLNGILNRIEANNTSRSLIEIRNSLPNYPLNKSDVFDICNNEDLSIAFKVVCIFAWGSMRQSTTGADLFFSNWDNYENNLFQITQELKNQRLSRSWAYEKLKRMSMHGCRPAYYTKILFFFGNGNTYIMDQWTSKSIELLWTTNDRIGIIFDNQRNYVQTNNHSGIYEEFCNRVENLTLAINNQMNTNFTPNEVEEMLFSNGGRDRGDWRAFVVANW